MLWLAAESKAAQVIRYPAASDFGNTETYDFEKVLDSKRWPTEPSLIQKALDRGHLIASQIQSANTIAELGHLTPKIEAYSDFVNEHFGVVDDYDGEKDCELSTDLYVALDWKKKSLYPEDQDNPSVQHLAERYMKDFLKSLDDKFWVKYSYTKKVEY